MSVDVEGPQYICPACGSEDVSLIGPDDVLMVCIDCGWKDSPESFDQFDGCVSDGETADEELMGLPYHPDWKDYPGK